MGKPKYSIERPSLEYLSFRGPHRISAGRTDEAGLPGLVFAPVFGRDLPVVALAHGWLQPAHRYADTLRFLASWGFIAVAPDTQRGPVPSHGALALDLQAGLHLMVAGKLGGGRVRADRNRMGVIGHSIGGGAAVLAAAAEKDLISAVVTVTPAPTKPSAVVAAARVFVPGLHLIGGSDDMGGETTTDSEAAALAAAWGGPAQLRTVPGTSHLGLAEGKHWTSLISGSGDEKKIQQVTRMLATAFLLRHVAGHDQLADELDGKVKGTKLEDLADAE